jgi:hypothetical protein
MMMNRVGKSRPIMIVMGRSGIEKQPRRVRHTVALFEGGRFYSVDSGSH